MESVESSGWALVRIGQRAGGDQHQEKKEEESELRDS